MKRSLNSQDSTLWSWEALNNVNERYQLQQLRLAEYLAALEGHEVVSKVGRELAKYLAEKFNFVYGSCSECDENGKPYFGNRDEMGEAYTAMYDAFTVLAAKWEQKDLPMGMFTTVCSAIDNVVKERVKEILDQEQANKKGVGES
jgi:hypothetical protein